MRTPWRLHALGAIALIAALGVTGCSDDAQNNDTGPIDRSDADVTTPEDGGDTSDAGDVDTPDDADIDADVDATSPDADASPTPDVTPDVDDGGDDAGDADECTGDADCDYDGLTDCEEQELGTAVCDPDTDGDNLNDLDELLQGTDPLVADTDGDGVEDGTEVDLGLDPTKQQSFADGQDDGQRWVVRACESPEGEPVNFYRSNNVLIDPSSSVQLNVGNWKVALPPSFNNYSELTVSGLSVNNGHLDDRQAAAVYDDPTNEVAGFMMSYTPPSSERDPLDVLEGHHDAIEAAGSIDQEFNGGSFNTHDFREAAIGRYLIRASTTRTYKQVRDALLFDMAPFGPSDVSGLPAPSGASYHEFRIFVSAIFREYRDGTKQVLTSVAVAPAEKYDAREKVQFRMDDLTNTTNIAEAVDGHQARCNIEEPKENSKADFYWMLDQSGSMSDDYNRVQSVANQFYNELNNTALDYRLGVGNMDESTQGKLRSAGWHRDLNTFLAEISAIINWTGNGFEEYGLKNAEAGIKYMLGISGNPPQNQKIRPDATLITIFISDEEAQSIQDNSLSGSTGQQMLANWINFFRQHTVAFSIVGDGNGCGSSDGEAYRQVAQGTGGSFTSLCAADISETIEDIIYAATGYTGYVMPSTPISSSLRVYINGQWVPRSRDNGFDYFAQTNSIAFFGSYRPEIAQGNEPPDNIAISYETWQDRSKD